MDFEQKLKVYPNGAKLVLTKTPNYYSSGVSVMFNVGSEDEPTEMGLSHLLEHELFNGTKNYSKEQLSEEFVKISGKNNASTSMHTTKFYCTQPLRHAKRALELISDMILNSVFDEDLLQKEKCVIIEEMKTSYDNEMSESTSLLFAKMFDGCGLKYHVIGKKEYFDKVTRQDLIDYMDRYYVAKNCVISIIGDMDIEEASKWCEELLVSKLKRGTKKVSPPAVKNKNVSVSYFKDIKQTTAKIGFYAPEFNSKYSVDIDIMNFIIGSPLHSRLYQRLRNQLSLVYFVGCGNAEMKNNGVFLVSYKSSPENQQIATEEVLNELKRLKENGFNEGEFEQAKNMVLDNFLMNLDKPNPFLSHVVLEGKLFDPNAYIKKLKSATAKTTLNHFFECIDITKPFEIYIGPTGTNKIEM